MPGGHIHRAPARRFRARRHAAARRPIAATRGPS